jgi:hypothetical protein
MLLRIALALVLAAPCIGWSPATTRHVAWSAVQFFPSDLARLVHRHHERFDAGIRRGLAAPPAWRAGPPGRLGEALAAQAMHCARELRRPIPLDDLVEEIGVLTVHALDANDPLAAIHADPREPAYASAYQQYVDKARSRVRLVYYGQDQELIYRRSLQSTIDNALRRSEELYPFVGEEFYRTGVLRDWRSFDDRSVAFGVAAIALSRGMTDAANMACFVWYGGGGLVPTPRSTPPGQTGPTLTVALRGGFPERDRKDRGRPAMPSAGIMLPEP